MPCAGQSPSPRMLRSDGGVSEPEVKPLLHCIPRLQAYGAEVRHELDHSRGPSATPGGGGGGGTTASVSNSNGSMKCCTWSCWKEPEAMSEGGVSCGACHPCSHFAFQVPRSRYLRATEAELPSQRTSLCTERRCSLERHRRGLGNQLKHSSNRHLKNTVPLTSSQRLRRLLRYLGYSALWVSWARSARAVVHS